jgi:predicted phosphodiesterase
MARTELDLKLQRYLTQVGLDYTIPQDIAIQELQRVNLRPQGGKDVIQKQLTDGRPALIIPLYDIHFGHNQCNLNKLFSIVTLIAKTENCYTFLGGDLSETATKQSVGKSVYDEAYHIKEQMRYMKPLLKPLADAGKILCAVSGNHEARIANMIGIDPLELLCDDLDIPYCEYQGYMLLNVGPQAYSVFCHHGVGGGRTIGAKANSATRFNQIALADLYVSGHTHTSQSQTDKIFVFDDITGELTEKIRHYVVASSFLEYFGGYAEQQALSPSITGATAIQLMGDSKEIRIMR